MSIESIMKRGIKIEDIDAFLGHVRGAKTSYM